MCGRYTIVKSAKELEKQFEIDINKEVYQPSYNLAPTQIAPVITNASPKQASFLQWGLIPSWAKDQSIGYKMINARSETLLEKPAFKTSFQNKRCVVLVDGFYEWKNQGKLKIPSYISLTSNKTFALAGLWDSWKNPTGENVSTFTIITTKANTFMQQIHQRMPCIFESNQQIKLWLDENISASEHFSLLQPIENEKMKMHEVSVLVNSPKNNKPSLISHVENFGTLF